MLQAPPSASRGAPPERALVRLGGGGGHEHHHRRVREHAPGASPAGPALRRARARMRSAHRARLVVSVPGRRSRARYGALLRAQAGDDVALYVGGFGEGLPTFIEPRLNATSADALAPTAGTPRAPTASLDHLPAGATGPDLRDVAPRHDPTRSETSGRKRRGLVRIGDGLTRPRRRARGLGRRFRDAFLDGASSASSATASTPRPSRGARSSPRRRQRAGGRTSTARRGPRGPRPVARLLRREEEKIGTSPPPRRRARRRRRGARHYAATLGPGFEDRMSHRRPAAATDCARGGLRGGQEARALARGEEAAVSSSDASDSDGGSGTRTRASRPRQRPRTQRRARRAAQPRETRASSDGRPVALG